MKELGHTIAIKNLLSVLLAASLLVSCQKEIDGSIDPTGGGTTVPVPTNQKPKVGTTWTYRYYTYYAFGGLATSTVLNVRAKSEDNYVGEKWLNMADKVTDTTVFLLNEKADGLYHYYNTSTLLCKAPAVVNDVYNSSILGMPEMFVVKGVKDSLATGLGTIAVNYYEGSRGGYIYDAIWYNEYAWIVKYEVYRLFPLTGLYYKYSTLALDNIVY